MKITRVTYGRTINLGNYESARVELTTDVAIDEDWTRVLQELKQELALEADKIKKGNK